MMASSQGSSGRMKIIPSKLRDSEEWTRAFEPGLQRGDRTIIFFFGGFGKKNHN